MLEYSSVCYKNSFLTQVIVRVDFAQFIQTNMVFDENIEKEILKIFPRRGKDQIIRFNSINVVFDQKNNGLPNANGEIIEGIQREYFTNDGGSKLILTNKFIIFEINGFSRYYLHFFKKIEYLRLELVFVILIFLTHPKSNCRKNILLQKLLLLCM